MMYALGPCHISKRRGSFSMAPMGENDRNTYKKQEEGCNKSLHF
jgi:hypothetical protein